MVTWAITSFKGGVLKTSLAVGLAGVMSKQGRKVLIVDMDVQSNVCLSFGIKNPDNLAKTIINVLRDGEPAESAIINVYENIDVLPSNQDLVFFEVDLLTKREKYLNPFVLLKKAIEPLKCHYDNVIIDCPPNMGVFGTGNILFAADGIVIPFQPEIYPMRSLVKIIDTVEDFKKNHDINPLIGVVATLVNKRTLLHRQVLEECAKFCEKQGLRMFETRIHRSIRYASSIAFNRLPLVLTEPKLKAAACYFDLFKEVDNIGK